VTTTLNGAFGAKVVAGGTGVLLNNEMDDTTVLQVVLNVVDHGMDLGAAIAAPRLHHQWLPDTLFVEPGRLTAAPRRSVL